MRGRAAGVDGPWPSLESRYSEVGARAARALAHVPVLLNECAAPVELADRLKRREAEHPAGPPRFLSVGIGVDDGYLQSDWYDPSPWPDPGLVKVEIGLDVDGAYVEVAETLFLGPVSAAGRRLVETCRGALGAAIGATVVGGRVQDIAAAVQRYVEERGLSVSDLGAGHAMRADAGATDNRVPPWIFNKVMDGGSAWSEGGELDAAEIARSMDTELVPGMILALEPMVNGGGPQARRDVRAVDVPDVGLQLCFPVWRTGDGAPTAKFVHTVLVETDGPHVLTLP